MTDYIPIFSGAHGLNIRDDPAQLKITKTGLAELAEAVNVDVKNSRRISRRPGRLSTSVVLPSHSLYSALGVTLFVSGTSLYRLDSGPVATQIKTGLTEGARMRFTDVNDNIYFANGYEKGVYNVSSQTVSDWTAGTYYGPRTNRTFESPPAGHLLEYWQSRIYIAKDNVLWFTEPHGYGWIDYSQNAYIFPARITMVRGVSGGLFVSTLYNLYFLEGNTAGSLKQHEMAAYGVVEGTDVVCDADELDYDMVGGAIGKGAVCTAQEGICFCGPGGTFRNMTKDHIYYPRKNSGTAYIYRGKYVAILD